MAKIGFIGLGHMGNPMVKNLLKHNHQVKVYDVMPEAIECLVAEGAEPANSAVDASKDADVVITMLQTGEQVSEVCLGKRGLFANMRKDALYSDNSSIAINTSRELHKQAQAAGIAMVEAPVSGGVGGAEAATLTIMVGGSAANFQRVKPIFEALGKVIIHAGSPGSGQAAKICNNMILGISMIAVCEGFNLAEKLGLDPKKLFEISSNASGQCWSMTSYCPVPGIMPDVPSSHDYKAGFTASMMLKDLRLSQDAAEVADAATPLGATAMALYDAFADQGNGQVDFSGIFKMIAEQNYQ